MTFKIQIPSEVIRNPDINHESFLVYGKLVQHYYVNKGKSHSVQIDHKKFMYFSNIKANQTFKKCINQLYEYELVNNKIDSLPRTGLIDIELNSKYICNNKDFSFAQLPYFILDKCVTDTIGIEGIRLLYYFKSYINKMSEFCYSSRETIAKEIGSNPKTVDKYVSLLKKFKFIKVDKHMLNGTGEYSDEFQKETFTKFNNHYFLRTEQFEEIHRKMKNSTGQ